MDYRKYQLSLWEEGRCIILAAGLTVVSAWILYKSIWGLGVFLILLPVCRKNYQRKKLKQRKRELLLQFVDSIQSVVTALLSGYSIENAWREAEEELEELYGKDAYMVMELRHMNAAVQMNQSLETVLYQFAVNSGCEDILDFAEVFLFAKRSGGNFSMIMKNTVLRIREKISVEQEIMTVIAGKKMEQKVMNAVPILLLAYLNLTSAEFLSPLYHNAFGVCVMTIAFGAYLGIFFLSKKMMNISL